MRAKHGKENVLMDIEVYTESAPMFGKPGGISWQASLLNFICRHTIKRHIERSGLSMRTTRSVVRLLELLTVGFGNFTTVHRKSVAGVLCDVVYPLNPPPIERVVLYLHGGGFFVHLPKSYKRFAQRLADVFGATVYVPAYRLAPEHRHPAATNDCLAVYSALLDDGCDPRQLCLMGDSAGGNLALVTLLRARDEKLPLPACAAVISPGADLTLSGASYSRNADADPFIPIRALHQVVEQYVGAEHATHPHVSPMLGDFTGLPPLAILVGSTEVLLDSSIATAESCNAAGVSVVLQVWRQMPHVFPLFSFLPEGRMAMQHMVDFFIKHIGASIVPSNGEQ
jgi:monoterpene epsilon-lactone hydrolase